METLIMSSSQSDRGGYQTPNRNPNRTNNNNSNHSVSFHQHSKGRMGREINVVVKVVLDVVCLLAVGLPILVLFFVGVPYQRGFFCDDESIRYPFKPSTITNNALYAVGIFFPVVVMLVTEIVRFVTSRKQRGGGADVGPSRTFLRWTVHPLVWQLYRKVGFFAFGGCLSQLTTDIAKYSIGRLRPHFFQVCDPDIDCTLERYRNVYIEEFQCRGTDAHLLKEARLSFISGHSSFSAYTMLFLALYLQSRMSFTGIRLLRPFLQAGCLYIAWYTALSRVSDYKHHWSDVLAGSLQGTVVALVTVFFISDLFSPKVRLPKPVSDSTLEKQIGYNSCALEVASSPNDQQQQQRHQQYQQGS